LIFFPGIELLTINFEFPRSESSEQEPNVVFSIVGSVASSRDKSERKVQFTARSSRHLKQRQLDKQTDRQMEKWANSRQQK